MKHIFPSRVTNRRTLNLDERLIIKVIWHRSFSAERISKHVICRLCSPLLSPEMRIVVQMIILGSGILHHHPAQHINADHLLLSCLKPSSPDYISQTRCLPIFFSEMVLEKWFWRLLINLLKIPLTALDIRYFLLAGWKFIETLHPQARPSSPFLVPIWRNYKKYSKLCACYWPETNSVLSWA